MHGLTFFLNAAAWTLMGVGCVASAMYAWDVNELPARRTRFTLLMFAGMTAFTQSSAWVVNGINEGQTPFGRFAQSWLWTGLSAAGAALVVWVFLAYRNRRIKRAEKRALVEAYLKLSEV